MELLGSTMENLAHIMFAAAAANLPYGKSVREDPAAAADLLCTLFINNLDAVTFIVEFAAAANQSEFLRTAYAGYRDTQRRQLANLLYGIAGDRAPTSLIGETVHWSRPGRSACRCGARSFLTEQVWADFESVMLSRLPTSRTHHQFNIGTSDAPQFNISTSNANFVDKLESVSA
jgi:hypothetical protein